MKTLEHIILTKRAETVLSPFYAIIIMMPPPQRRQPPPRRRSLLGLLRPQRTESLPIQQNDEPIKHRVVQRRRSISLTTSLLASYSRGGGGGKATASAEDEELSVTTSSTCTSYLTASTTTTTTTSVKKSVRFAGKDKNVYYENEQLCLEECQELWIYREEYQKLQRSLQFLSTGLERAEKFAADNPSSYTNVLLYVYALCSDQTRAACHGSINRRNENPALILSQDEMQELTQRLRLSSNRLGLERRIIPQFRQERYSQRREMLQQIQQIQSLHNNNNSSSISHRKGGNNNNNTNNTAACTAVHIRQACESISRPSRLFSLHMAHALAATL
jgi:hypothetical protein